MTLSTRGAVMLGFVLVASPARAQTDDPSGFEVPELPPADVSFLAEAAFVGVFGLLPEPWLGAVGGIGIRAFGVEVTLGAIATPDVEAHLNGSTTRGGRFGLAAGRLRAGYAFVVDPVEIVPSVTLDVGATWGRGFGVSHPTTGTGLLAELGVGVEARVALVREAAIAAFAQFVVPLARPRFFLAGEDGGRVFQPNEVGAVLGLGVTLRAP